MEDAASSSSGCTLTHPKRKRDQETLFNDLQGPTANHGLENDVPVDTLKSSEPDPIASDNSDEDAENDYDEDNYEEYEYDTELIDNDCNYNLASKFDDMDLPPGVEAAIPWLVPPERPSDKKPEELIEDEIDIKFKSFKQFDTVEDYSDHHYAAKSAKETKPAADWAKRIQHEWKVLENDLPETIFVRVYEDRMDLLRAVIIGPVGTPYHDGLFFFDAKFPSNYPNVPPLVYYHSGGLRLNPNLYDNGYVCLSLLGTWNGQGCENWCPSVSTMLQVLVSIQALVLNDKPYFNEPGYEMHSMTPHGKKRSLAYNEDTFVLSCRTMLYSLRRPPKHFEDFVAGHFRMKGRTILAACKAYMDGAQVGCDVKDGEEDDREEDDGEGNKSGSSPFKSLLQKLFEDLLMEFTVKGADCDRFLAQKVKTGGAAVAAKAADATTRP